MNNIYKGSYTMENPYLAHHGVKGMEWGHHKYVEDNDEQNNSDDDERRKAEEERAAKKKKIAIAIGVTATVTTVAGLTAYGIHRKHVKAGEAKTKALENMKIDSLDTGFNTDSGTSIGGLFDTTNNNIYNRGQGKSRLLDENTIKPPVDTKTSKVDHKPNIGDLWSVEIGPNDKSTASISTPTKTKPNLPKWLSSKSSAGKSTASQYESISISGSSINGTAETGKAWLSSLNIAGGFTTRTSVSGTPWDRRTRMNKTSHKSRELLHYYLAHSGVKGMKWGINRYRNPDGTLNDAGKARYKDSGERKTVTNMSDQELRDATNRFNNESNYHKSKGDFYKSNGGSPVNIGVKALASGIGSFLVVGGAKMIYDLHFKDDYVNIKDPNKKAEQKRKIMSGAAILGGISAAVAATTSVTTSLGGQIQSYNANSGGGKNKNKNK